MYAYYQQKLTKSQTKPLWKLANCPDGRSQPAEDPADAEPHQRTAIDTAWPRRILPSM